MDPAARGGGRVRTGHGSQEELAGVESGDDADEATDSTR